MPIWKSGGYTFRMYQNDHPPPHVHIFKDGKQLDRYDMENGEFMDGTIGRYEGRALQAMRDAGLIE